MLVRLLSFGAAGLAFALASGSLGSGDAAAAEKVTWNWAIYGPPRAVTSGIEHFAKMAAEKTGGKFNIRLHYGESIVGAKDVLDAHKINSIQGALTAYSYTPGKTPLQQVLDLPYLPIPDLDAQIQVHDAYQKHPAVAAELARWNAFSLATVPLPQYEFMGVGKAPQQLEGWKGKRVRAVGGLGDAMVLLGAIPTSVSAPEVYQGLERGTFDAASFPFTYSFGAYRLHEISKWYTIGMQPGVVHNSLTVSLDAWKALPEEYRKILEEARPEHYRIMKERYAQEDAKWLPVFKAKLEEVRFTPEMFDAVKEIAGRPVWDKWVSEMEAKGLPGRELLDVVLAEAKKVSGS